MTVSPAFDEKDRPSAKVIQDCVHCGFCLSACPTYLKTGDETDSPRGRIHLIKAASEGRIAMAGPLVEHLDLCLGCLACETACPSGVRYRSLIESSRGQIERRYKRNFRDNMLRSFIFWLFPYAQRMRMLVPFAWLAGVLRLKKLLTPSLLNRISPSISSMFHMLPDVKSPLPHSLSEFYPALGKRKKKVALLTGCVQSAFFPEINKATVDVLTASGCDVVVPQKQGCCGALSLHSGRIEEGRAFARNLVDVFSEQDFDALVINSAGCGSSVKDYVDILGEDPNYSKKAQHLSEKTLDVMEFLAETEISEKLGKLDIKVTYQDACHVVHGQGIKSAPRELLQSIPGLELIELSRPDHCCGSAGIYSIVQPEMSQRILSEKICDIEQTATNCIAVANPGCIIQISKGLADSGSKTVVRHPVEILSWSLQNYYG